MLPTSAKSVNINVAELRLLVRFLCYGRAMPRRARAVHVCAGGTVRLPALASHAALNAGGTGPNRVGPIMNDSLTGLGTSAASASAEEWMPPTASEYSSGVHTP
eukprot:4806342-Pleurochrysis_carterae.AAC.1